MPVNLIGVAISTAFFPQLTEEVGDGQESRFRQTFRTALSTIIWIALPVAVIAFFARGYVVSFIKNGGDPLIASILTTLIISIFAQSIFQIATRGFYAKQDTKTPFRVSIFAIGLTILLAIIFSLLGLGPEGLGYAQSIGNMLEVSILLSLLHKRSERKLLDHDFWRGVGKTALAATITGCVAYSMTKFIPLLATDDSIFATLPKFILITGVSLIAYIIASYFLGIDQVRPIIERIKKTLFKNLS
jgi:putative peptidoglycan lipid II flippase